MYTFNLHANQGIEYSSAVSILALIRADTVREPHSRVLFFSISLNKKNDPAPKVPSRRINYNSSFPLPRTSAYSVILISRVSGIAFRA